MRLPIGLKCPQSNHSHPPIMGGLIVLVKAWLLSLTITGAPVANIARKVKKLITRLYCHISLDLPLSH